MIFRFLVFGDTREVVRLGLQFGVLLRARVCLLIEIIGKFSFSLVSALCVIRLPCFPTKLRCARHFGTPPTIIKLFLYRRTRIICWQMCLRFGENFVFYISFSLANYNREVKFYWNTKHVLLVLNCFLFITRRSSRWKFANVDKRFLENFLILIIRIWN